MAKKIRFKVRDIAEGILFLKIVYHKFFFANGPTALETVSVLTGQRI